MVKWCSSVHYSFFPKYILSKIKNKKTKNKPKWENMDRLSEGINENHTCYWCWCRCYCYKYTIWIWYHDLHNWSHITSASALDWADILFELLKHSPNDWIKWTSERGRGRGRDRELEVEYVNAVFHINFLRIELIITSTTVLLTILSQTFRHSLSFALIHPYAMHTKHT